MLTCTFLHVLQFFFISKRNGCVAKQLGLLTSDHRLPGSSLTCGQFVSKSKWARAWQNKQNYLCTHLKLTSAWASTQSDQSLLSAGRRFGSLATHKAHREDWSDWAEGQGWSDSLLGAQVIVLVLPCFGSNGTWLHRVSHNRHSMVLIRLERCWLKYKTIKYHFVLVQK